VNFFIPISCIMYIVKSITSKWVSFNNFIIYKTMWQLEWHLGSKKVEYVISKLVLSYYASTHECTIMLVFLVHKSNFSCILWVNPHPSFGEFLLDQCRSTLSSPRMGITLLMNVGDKVGTNKFSHSICS
jgi:hypothetical protein